MTLEELRAERNARLAASDYRLCPDVFDILPDGPQQMILIYRKALRDLPAAYEGQEDIESVEWPELKLKYIHPH